MEKALSKANQISFFIIGRLTIVKKRDVKNAEPCGLRRLEEQVVRHCCEKRSCTEGVYNMKHGTHRKIHSMHSAGRSHISDNQILSQE